jgi:uridine phosphorylase
MGKYIGINENKIAESELIINPDGSIYHIKLLPEHIAKDIIVVGDPARVELIIGTDNIDIVINELDAAVNIDLKTRIIKEEKTSLNIVRIGTSGALQADIPVDSFVMSDYGLGFDGLMQFYSGWEHMDEQEFVNAFIKQADWKKECAKPYIIKGSEEFCKKIGEGFISGITATAPGFYGPQGRVLRAAPAMAGLNEKLTQFNYKGTRITNFEMETSALYGLGRMLGHNTCTVCAIIANRMIKEYSKDYKKAVDKLISLVLERLTT